MVRVRLTRTLYLDQPNAFRTRAVGCPDLQLATTGSNVLQLCCDRHRPSDVVNRWFAAGRFKLTLLWL